MSVLNIRNVPEDLTSAVKIAAVKAGLPIREFVIKSLSDTVGFKAAEKLPKFREPIIDKKAAKMIEKKLRAPQRHNEKHVESPAKKAIKGPKKEFCDHGLRYCAKCPGFHD